MTARRVPEPAPAVCGHGVRLDRWCADCADGWAVPDDEPGMVARSLPTDLPALGASAWLGLALLLGALLLGAALGWAARGAL